MSKVTSVELDEEDVNYIDSLIEEGRVRSLKEFVEKCVKFGITYTLDKWQPGILTVGPVRVVIVIKKIIDLLTEHVALEDYENVGNEIGEIIKSFAMFHYQADTTKNRDKALRIMSDMGLGQFLMPNNETIQVVSPAMPADMLKNCIETVLDLKLESTKLKIDVQLYKISKGK